MPARDDLWPVLDYVAARLERSEPLADYLGRAVREPASPRLRRAFDAYLAQRPDFDGSILSIPEAITVGRAIFEELFS